MNNIRTYNLELLAKVNELQHSSLFSCPLLVSSKEEYINNVKENSNSIMYIGQETNTWLNSSKDNIALDYIEYWYYRFLVEEKGNNKEFWRYIKKINDEDMDHVIWTNALVLGSRKEKGTPTHYNEIKELSINNLIYLYEYFKPNMTLIVAGSKNPYYEIITKFLNTIDSSIEKYPSRGNLIVSDEEKNIHWTYHPNYLQRIHEFENTNLILKKIKE